MKKTLSILGSTGSIGINALNVVRKHPEKFRVEGLSGHTNSRLLLQQIEEFHPVMVAVTDSEACREMTSLCNRDTCIVCGVQGAIEVATLDDVDMVVSAMVGAAGLLPTLAAIRAGKDIALANKETLVIGGALIASALSESDVLLLPVDSEHSAIFQSIQGHDKTEIKRLILTASGGPFRTWHRKEMKAATLEEALRHPNWTMGSKITIDSATMMNKGLEMIEAHWLFDVDPESIDILIHPESIVHSMVEYVDGVVIAQLGIPDMRIPIAYALGYPHRLDMNLNRLDFTEIGKFTFESPDTKKFPAITLAYEAIRKGKTYPAVMNAANEEAVRAFLRGGISFTGIHELVGHVMGRHKPLAVSLENILEADAWARREAAEYLKMR
jgi:1-deoxy-D-xylulose-5-phosphate reductoisomerase